MGGAAKTILPIAATALGAYFLGPMIATGAGVSAAAGTAIGGAVGGMAASALNGGPEEVAPPPPSTPNAMPIIGGTESEAAARKTITALRTRQGRAASILSQGGLDNSSTKLGG